MTKIEAMIAKISKLFGDAMRGQSDDYDGPAQRQIADMIGTHHPVISETINRFEDGNPSKSLKLFFGVCAAAGVAPIFVPKHLAVQAEVEFCDKRKPDAVGVWAITFIEAALTAAHLKRTDVALMCGCEQPHVSGMISRYKRGDLPKSTRFLFSMATACGLVPLFVRTDDLDAVVKTFDRLRETELSIREKVRERLERARIADNLVELKAWKEAWPKHPSFEQVNANGKLTLEEIAYIRGTDDSLDVIADKLDIVKSTASYVRNGISWPAPFPYEPDLVPPQLR